MNLHCLAWILTALLSILHGAHAYAETWTVDIWPPGLDYRSQTHTAPYTPLDRASNPWKICVSYPHLKDPYWLSVNYGMVTEAHRLGVGFRLFEAGGYPNTDRQIGQIEDCTASGADGLIVGAVSYSGLSDVIAKTAENMPVVAAVNDISPLGISAKIGVSWIEMGRVTGRWLANRHPAGSQEVKIALFPGPEGPEWVTFLLEGFYEAIKRSAVSVVITKRGDTGKEIQRTLVEETLEEASQIDYIVGTSVTAEAAISLLRDNATHSNTEIVSFYLTHGVYRGIKRRKILASPTDRPVLQGRLSIEQMVRELDGTVIHSHMGPAISMIDITNIKGLDITQSLAPALFTPVFNVSE